MSIPDAPAVPTASSEAFPTLSPEQFARLVAYGVPEDIQVGDELFRAGDRSIDLIVVERGTVDIVRPATHDAPEEVVATHGAGRFLGELNLLTGQIVYLTGRVVEAGHVYRISPEQFRRLMADDTELSDLLLRALLARRLFLKSGAAAQALEIVGSSLSAGDAGAADLCGTSAAPARLGRLRRRRRSRPDGCGGPRERRSAGGPDAGGRAAQRDHGRARRALSGCPTTATSTSRWTSRSSAPARPVSPRRSTARPRASPPCCSTPSGTGGQAAASSRIENYLGFPSGISGADLTGRAVRAGAEVRRRALQPVPGRRRSTRRPDQLQVVLADGTRIPTRAVVIATGARYRALPLERWADFEGAGIYYAATELEARDCAAAR